MRHLLNANVNYNSLSAEFLVIRISGLVKRFDTALGKGFILQDEYLQTKRNIIARTVISSKVLVAIFKG